MKHGSVTRYESQEDGTVKITREGYYDELNSIKESIRLNISTTKQTLLQDVIRALETFTTTDTPEMTLELVKGRDGHPQRIVKTYVTLQRKL